MGLNKRTGDVTGFLGKRKIKKDIKYRKMKRKGYKRDWSCINRLLVNTLVWPTTAPRYHNLSHLFSFLRPASRFSP